MSTAQGLLARAVAAAQSAGAVLLDERPATLTVSAKSTAVDAVTEMDRQSESLLISALLAGGPDDAVLGEEGGSRAGTSGVRWIVDPLDGTVNYIYDLPEWSVSIAAELDGEVVAGVVLAPRLGWCWTAIRRGGADRVTWPVSGTSERLTVGDEVRLGHALVGTGFGYDADRRRQQAQTLLTVLPQVRDIRRAGSAAIDLCRVADGSYDAYYEWGLNEWDLAAGALIAQEAGALVGGCGADPAGNAMVCAANPSLYEPLRRIVCDAAQSTRRNAVG